MTRGTKVLRYMLLIGLAVVLASCGSRFSELSGTVVDGSGRAISQAQVQLGDALATTGSDGAFVFRNVTPGEYTLKVYVNGEEVNRSLVTVDRRPTSVQIVVAKGRVAGTVVDHEGKAVAGAIVSVGDISAPTASNGSFVLDGIYYGTQTVDVAIDGSVAHSVPVVVDQPQVTVAITLPSCLPGPNAPPGMKLVYCEDFTGADNLRALGWEPTAGWTIIEADGKRWIASPASGLTSTYVTIPEMGNADKVVVEYKTRFVAGSDIYGVNILANEFPGGDLRRGGTNFFAASTGKGKTVNMRKITNNNYPGITQGFDHHFRPTTFDVPDGSVVTLRITYDHTAKILDLHYNGHRAPGYPWNLPDDALIKGSSHNKLILFARDTTAHWTDIKVWVSR